MGSLVYSMISTVDGFIEDAEGSIAATEPDEELHRFANEEAARTEAFLYGRRLYETMRWWQSQGDGAEAPGYITEFARVWRGKPKYVFSRTLDDVPEPGHTLVGGEAGPAIDRLRREHDGEVAIGGPALAAEAARLGLIDEYRLLLQPHLFGGGKGFFPSSPADVELRLLETRRFEAGTMYLRYEVVR